MSQELGVSCYGCVGSVSSVSALASLARWRSRLPSRGELRLAEAGVGLGWWVAAGNSELGTARAGAELGSAEAGAELGSAHAGAGRGMAEGSAGGAGFGVMRESARLNSGRLRSSPTVRTPHGC